MVVSANCNYLNSKLLNICLEEVVRDVNVFGLMICLRDCSKFKTYTAIFMDGGLGNFTKGFVDRTVFSMYLRLFVDYRVDLLNQFLNTNQFVCGC